MGFLNLCRSMGSEYPKVSGRPKCMSLILHKATFDPIFDKMSGVGHTGVLVKLVLVAPEAVNWPGLMRTTTQSNFSRTLKSA